MINNNTNPLAGFFREDTLAYSLDHAGPRTRTVEDNALMLDLIARYDALDPTSTDIRAPSCARRRLTGAALDPMK